MTTRRDFLQASAAVAAAMAALPRELRASPGVRAVEPVAPAPRSLSVLILGGTRFTGPAQVEYALARGHRVTVFNRQRTRPGFYEGTGVEELVGDLGGDTSALVGRSFDVVMDNPTTLPAWVRNVARELRGNVGHYVFQSSTAVYRHQLFGGSDEASALAVLPAGLDPYTLDHALASRYYGAFKARAEREVAVQYAGRWTVLRPSRILGPMDPDDRLAHWASQMEQGGELVVPYDPDDACQFIDVRDLAEFGVRVAEQRVFGAFDVVGPTPGATVADLLYGVKAVVSAPGRLKWEPGAGASPAPSFGMPRRSSARAVARGLRFRSVAETAAATLAWRREWVDAGSGEEARERRG